MLLALQVVWCQRVERAFANNINNSNNNNLEEVVQQVVRFLSVLAENIAKDLKKDLRQKFEQIITDYVHQRDVTRGLHTRGVKSPRDFAWQYHMRFTWLAQAPPHPPPQSS